MDAFERIMEVGLIPVVSFEDASQAVPASRALLAAGLGVVEATMRTDAGVEAIRRVTAELPGMLVGAGTVLSVEKAMEAAGAGASFIAMPGFDDDVVAWCVKNGVAAMPGCVTPTEIQAAMRRGLRVLKFFPAGAYGGAEALKALSGPFGPFGVRFVPTGGIDASNLAEYLCLPSVAAVGGGWLCSKRHLEAGDYAGIAKTAAEAIEISRAARKAG